MLNLKKCHNKGFTLVELVIVMAVIGLILSAVIPNLRGMQVEGQLTKSEAELNTLKTAITSFWRNNGNAYPTDIVTALTGASPAVITSPLGDPWKTDGTNNTYGYSKGNDATFGDYFIVYTKGPQADTAPSFDGTLQKVKYTGSGRVVSNAPLLKQ